MTLLLRQQRNDVRAGFALLRRLGDQAAVLLPGVGNPDGSHWITGASLVPTAGTLGPDGVTRPAQAWFQTYLDSMASTPTAVDSPVGFLSDGDGTVGPELIVNGGFSNGSTGWSTGAGASISGGACNFSASGDSLQQVSVFTAGATYRLSITKLSASSSTLTLYVGQGGQKIVDVITSATGPLSFVFTATATDKLLLASNGYVGGVTGISVKQLTGRHATQTTGSAKPVLRRGGTNRVPYSDFSTGWTFGSITPTGGQVGPTGASDAVLWTAAATNYGSVYNGSMSLVAGQVYTLAIDLKLGTSPSFRVAVANGTFSTNYLASTEIATQITGGGWGIGVVQFTAPTTDSGARLIFMRDCAAAGQTAYTRRCALFDGTLTAQQILALGGIPLTTTVAASTSAGNYALSHSNNNNATFLQTSIATKSTGTLICGITPAALAYATVYGSTNSGGGVPGIALKLRNDGGVWARTVNAAGTTADTTASNVYQAGVPLVLSMSWAYPGNLTLRKNGVTLNSLPLSIDPTGGGGMVIGSDSQGVAGEWFNGLTYFGIRVDIPLTAAELLVLERFVAALTGPVPNALKF